MGLSIDREKVIKGLEICSEHGSWHGLDCEHNEAYKDCPYRGCETGCIVTIAKDAIALLKEQKPREITKDEWESWKKAKYRDPLCMYWRGDITPIWILRPWEVHEPAYLIGDIKIFNGKIDKEKMHEIWLKKDGKEGETE